MWQNRLGKWAEYIALGVRPGVEVRSVGRILLKPFGGGIELHNEFWLPNQPSPPLPEDASLDYRGVVYLIATVGTKELAIGFIHNLYTFEDQRSLVRGQIYNMLNTMSPDNNVYRYLGGDFNLDPALVGTDRTGQAWPLVETELPTTRTGNIFDYWYCPFGQGGQPQPGVYYGTQNPLGQTGLSDHAGIYLRII
jgi:hypothetical protein